MVDLKSIPMNKATMAMVTLVDAAAMGVVMFWSLITLITISKTESTSTYKGSLHTLPFTSLFSFQSLPTLQHTVVGFYFFLAIILLLMVIAAFIVLLRTRALASPKSLLSHFSDHKRMHFITLNARKQQTG